MVQKVVFKPGLPYLEGPKVFSVNEIFVNLSPSGMYDKMLFEAACCECLVLTTSKDFAGLVDERFHISDERLVAIADKLEKLLALPASEREVLGKKMREIALTQSLDNLATKLSQTING